MVRRIITEKEWRNIEKVKARWKIYDRIYEQAADCVMTILRVDICKWIKDQNPTNIITFHRLFQMKNIKAEKFKNASFFDATEAAALFPSLE